MSWRGNSATVTYVDGNSEARSFNVDAAFGDLGIRFLQAIPSELGVMPFRLCVQVPRRHKVGTIVITDVTDLNTYGPYLESLADSVLNWVEEYEAGVRVEFRNGSGTRRMTITKIEVKTAGEALYETDDPEAKATPFVKADKSGLRSEF